MSEVILSSKRQVVLPADLCRRLAVAPGSRVRVELAPDGDALLVRPARNREEKPASVLFDRVVRRGPSIPVEDLQGLAAARRLARAGSR